MPHLLLVTPIFSVTFTSLTCPLDFSVCTFSLHSLPPPTPTIFFIFGLLSTFLHLPTQSSSYPNFLTCPHLTTSLYLLQPLPLQPALAPFSFSLSHSLTTSFVKMKTKSSLPKYFYSCSLTKQGAETKQKDVQAYLSWQQKDGKLSPCGLFTVIWNPPPTSLSSLSCPV